MKNLSALRTAAEALSVLLLIVLVFEAFAPRTFLRPDRTIDYTATAVIRHAGPAPAR
ncbi:MAG: hypothetical protein KGM42_11805 [Hyphomicrobiales bacterium]|nr:hypothetical protein [Hyphomicrobiales bacterium]